MSRTTRKPYTKTKAFDKTCRGGGGCPACEGNRLHKHRKKLTLEQALNQLNHEE